MTVGARVVLAVGEAVVGDRVVKTGLGLAVMALVGGIVKTKVGELVVMGMVGLTVGGIVVMGAVGGMLGLLVVVVVVVVAVVVGIEVGLAVATGAVGLGVLLKQ